MLCCAECFGDKGLKKQIVPDLSVKNGACSFCKSKNQALIDPKDLVEYFEVLVGIYRPDDRGRLLIEWLKEDWSLFGHPNLDQMSANVLLGEILDDGEIIRKNFVPSEPDETDLIEAWERLTTELLHTNRFFPSTEFDHLRLEGLLSNLVLDQDDHPDHWYRARIERGNRRYPPEEMGAPPERHASHGRANPAGIPYLYLGSLAKTAVAEIRPYPGETVCVAVFETVADLQFVDFRDPRSLISPFLLSDESVLAQLRGGDIEYLESLSRGLTTPVVPTDAAINYTPSQYLCEFIKKCGYHGVIYSSSVSEGMNLALFDPEKAVAGEISEFSIISVSVDMREIEE